MTTFPKAAVYKATGSAAPQQSTTTPTNTTSVPNQLYPCAVENYSVETVTLDLRDIQPTTHSPTAKPIVGEDGKPIVIVDEDGKPVVGEDGEPPQIWSVVLQTAKHTETADNLQCPRRVHGGCRSETEGRIKVCDFIC